MKEFFDRIDAKVAAFFKAKFSRKAVPAVATPVDLEEFGAPIFLLVGSLTDCSMKDAVAYARGLAESYITAPELGRIRVFEDRAHGRFIYELQEGGPGLSIIEKILEQFEAGHKVLVRLTNGAHAALEETHGEIISLIYPAEQDAIPVHPLAGAELEVVTDDTLWNIEELCGTVPLNELYPQDKKLVHVGGAILGVALSLFILTGGVYAVNRSGALDGDAMLRLAKAGQVADEADNPVWQLDKAKAAAKDGQTIRVLKKDANGWSWELAK